MPVIVNCVNAIPIRPRREIQAQIFRKFARDYRRTNQSKLYMFLYFHCRNCFYASIHSGAIVYNYGEIRMALSIRQYECGQFRTCVCCFSVAKTPNNQRAFCGTQDVRTTKRLLYLIYKFWSETPA